MRGMRRVAYQDDVVNRPRLNTYGWELTPDALVDRKRVALQMVREQRFEVTDCGVFFRVLEPCRWPRFFTAFDDEGRHARSVLIRVHAPQSVVVVTEIKRERRKRLARAEPDEPTRR